MKKFAAFLAFAAIFATAVCAFAATPSATFTLTPSATQLTSGETVTVTYKAKFANADSKIAGLQNVIKYDTSVFEFVSASKGTDLPSTAEPETGTAGEVGFGLMNLSGGDSVSDNKEYAIGSMTLKVKSGAALGTATLTQTETMFMLPDFEERTPSAAALSLTIAKAVTGTIKITTTPAEGKWSIDGGKTWKDSGVSVSELQLKEYTVTFKDLEGYTKPADINVELTKAAPTVTKSASYKGKPGFIEVTFTPENIAKEAQWSVDGGANWNDGGAAQEIPSGAYTIQFKEIEGYETPKEQPITVEKDKTVKVTAEYIEKPDISPKKAEFYKKSPEDLVFTLKGITAVTAVKFNDEDLIADEEYEYADGTLTVSQDVFAEEENGDYKLTVTTDKGDLTADVKIADERPSSDSGCNAGFGALAMLFAVPLFYRKKD